MLNSATQSASLATSMAQGSVDKARELPNESALFPQSGKSRPVFAHAVQFFYTSAQLGLVLGLGVAWWAVLPQTQGSIETPYYLVLGLASLLFPFLLSRLRKFDLHQISRGETLYAPVLGAWFMSALIGTCSIFAAKLSADVSRAWFALWLTSTSGGLVSVQWALQDLVKRWDRAGRLSESVILIGGGDHGQEFIRWFTKNDAYRGRLRLLGYFDDRSERTPKECSGVSYKGNIKDLLNYIDEAHVDEIFIALPWAADERIMAILERLRHLTVNVRVVPERVAFRISEEAKLDLIANSTLLAMRQPIEGWGRFYKVLVDKLLAATFLALASWLLVLIAIAIKLEDGGPVFFRQKRLGFDNRPFYILKFRTMRQSKEIRAELRQAIRGDSRVTRIGAFLRKSSLDELPQLINVLRSDMSLVGPRPHPVWRSAADLWADTDAQPLDAIVAHYAARHRVKPGITGWAQVKGYRGETETVEKMQKRIELDLHYIKEWSLLLDVKILFMTVLALLRSANTY